MVRESQSSITKLIADKSGILPSAKSYYSYLNSPRVDLHVKKVDSISTGRYDCTAYDNDDEVKRYWAFLMALDEKPVCAQNETLSSEYPAGTKIVYCYANYTGDYSPTVTIKSIKGGIRKMRQFSKHEPIGGTISMVGGCALILQDSDYNCTVEFLSPPPSLILNSGFDQSAPGLPTICTQKLNDDSQVPEWLKGNCETSLVQKDYTKLPKNTAALIDETALLNCSVINSIDHSDGSWSLRQSQSDQLITLTEAFNVTDQVDEHVHFPVNNVFNIEVKATNRYTAGLFVCTGYDTAKVDSFGAFLSVMDKPSCSHQSLSSDKKLAYCFNQYASFWPPTVRILKNNVVIDSASFHNQKISPLAEYSQVGACALIDKTTTFECTNIFERPPDNLLVSDSIDDTDTDLIASCSETSDPSDDRPVPDWLKEKCESYFEVGEITTTASISTTLTKTTLDTTILSLSSKIPETTAESQTKTEYPTTTTSNSAVKNHVELQKILPFLVIFFMLSH
ncbi:DgyrCDS846 [Dimorphilus gyrociliatus]|uniref:DgyrCDS846 n=1 Tax=Dimorphilus gyrociliatus TaxID=2664684 RepID=A0A7I8V8D9_9ANNE|nr:DgyrCDS846 [Dimorphilus gyrociliatus]